MGFDCHHGQYDQWTLFNFFVEEEGAPSSFSDVQEIIEEHGLFSSFYSDRDSHYWYTQEAGGKVDKYNITQLGQAMKRLGIEMIATHSPQARGRSECMPYDQERLPKELALAGITDMEEAANHYLKEVYMPVFNATVTL